MSPPCLPKKSRAPEAVRKPREGKGKGWARRREEGCEEKGRNDPCTMPQFGSESVLTFFPSDGSFLPFSSHPSSLLLAHPFPFPSLGFLSWPCHIPGLALTDIFCLPTVAKSHAHKWAVLNVPAGKGVTSGWPPWIHKPGFHVVWFCVRTN